jgi:hypothetical protein
MKSSKKIISRRVPGARLKKFSKHWLEAVKLSDISVLADSAADEAEGGSSNVSGGEIYYQIPGYDPIMGVGAYVSPWNSSNPNSNPPIFNYSDSYIGLLNGSHYGELWIENTPNGWRTVAMLDSVVLISSPYDYTGCNQTYLEIDLDTSGNWTFWADFGSVGGNRGNIPAYSQSLAQFGCSAGPGDYLFYNAFSNCAVNYYEVGWEPANFPQLPQFCTSAYQAVGQTEDSVLFEDNPAY